LTGVLNLSNLPIIRESPKSEKLTPENGKTTPILIKSLWASWIRDSLRFLRFFLVFTATGPIKIFSLLVAKKINKQSSKVKQTKVSSKEHRESWNKTHGDSPSREYIVILDHFKDINYILQWWSEKWNLFKNKSLRF